MGWNTIQDRDKTRLLELYRLGQHTELVNEATLLGLHYGNPESLSRQLRRYQASKKHLFVENENDDRPHWLGYMRHDTNDALFIGDSEIPDHSEELFYYAQQVQHIYELNTVIFTGDMMKQDEPGVATHDTEWQYPQPTFEENLDTCHDFFNSYAHVPHRFAISGNHDAHVARNTQGSVSFNLFFRNSGIQFSRYSYMYLNTCRGPVKVTHPNRKFGEGGAAIEVGRRINWKDTIKAHIIMAHTHQGVRGHTKDGRYEILALGCMRDPLKTQYKNTDDNTFGEWQPGFAFMKDGFFYMLNLYTTNWKAVLNGSIIA